MKKLILLICFIWLNAYSVSYYKKQIKNASNTQLYLAKFIAYNAKKDNLKYTMLAIAWKESQWGRYTLNLADPSAGVFHKLLPTYCMELGLKPNKWNMSRVAEQLIKSPELAYKVAVNDFKRNFRHFKMLGYSDAVSWRLAVMSYNAGMNNYKAGSRYYKEIVKIIKALHQLEF